MKMNKSTTKSYTSINSQSTKEKQLKLHRPDSSVTKLCDLHVYKVPPELWREAFNNILNNAVTETVSVGIIRVPTETRLLDIREEIVQQLSTTTEDLIPRDYVFLRSVGRSLTTLRLKQEYQLKAKHFIPPVAYAPELFILEATPEIRDALNGSNASSQSPPLSRQVSPRSYPSTYRAHNGAPELERRNKPNHRSLSPVQKLKALPHIPPDPHRGREVKRFSNPDPYNHFSPSSRTGSPTYNNPYHMNHNSNRRHDNSPQHKKQPRDVGSEQPGSEWDEEPVDKPSSKEGSPPQKHSPQHSAGKSRRHRHEEDSGVAGLSPEDDFLQEQRNKEEYDNIFKKAKELQKHLESDRFSIDETDEERKRRLEDLEGRNDLDRERWDADQNERKRRAKEDILKENERKRQKENEEKRQKEDAERRQKEDEKRKEKENERRQKNEEEMRQKEDEERRQKEEEERKRQKEEERRKNEEKERKEEEERKKREKEEKRRDEEQKRLQEEEKKKHEEEEKRELEKEEAERKKREEVERHKKEKEEQEKRRKKEEEERRQREELERQKEKENLRNLKKQIVSPEPVIRDTESARQRRRDEKNQLLNDLEMVKQARQNQEKIREELVRRAKQMQHRTTNRRNEARDMWKKKYFEEKKKTAPMEESSNRLRNKLDSLHKRLVNTLEGLDPKDRHLRITDSRPSEKNNYVIQSTKLQHEIEDLQRRVENARMKLTAEMKLRNQAQGELRALRAELTQRTQTIEQKRHQQLASLNSSRRGNKENNSPSENTNTNSEHSRSSLDGL